ncbi:SH3 domain-containing protein [uncultured Acidaminococcus sp.]|uniref:C40 family peptidase n=1 Tax=uncultured Acidaminococcus sp. TaxID=352152 RepID=UPI0028046C82|nr:SH3 domain-containing protein [uncultured Acidaminococcus sp.]
MLHAFHRISLLTGALCLSASVALAAAAMPGTSAALTKASAWTTAAGNTVLATPERIKAMNAQMDKATFGDSIQDLGASISGDKLTGYVNSFGMDEDQYIQRDPISHSFASQLVQDAKANIRPTNTVKYGVVVDRVDLRSFPTLQRAFDSASDTQFDNWQETAVDPATPVRVYHTNPQGNFIFVRTPHYRGWVPRNKVAITDAKTWQTYANPVSPAVVTGRVLTLQAGTQPQLYQMGTAIPTQGGNLLLPTRNHQGYLQIVPVKAVYGADLHQGYLPYTANNTIEMAFKHLGAPYGWGGMHNSVDCSAFVQDVYKTMGIQLPRNGDEQAQSFPGKSFQGMTHAEKLAYIKTAAPGSLLFTPYHVMMVLGNYNGTPYMIHSLASYGMETSSGVVKNRIMQVVVSKVDLLAGSGTPLVDQMTQCNTWK